MDIQYDNYENMKENLLLTLFIPEFFYHWKAEGTLIERTPNKIFRLDLNILRVVSATFHLSFT